jgi:hypothetical protein
MRYLIGEGGWHFEGGAWALAGSAFEANPCVIKASDGDADI